MVRNKILLTAAVFGVFAIATPATAGGWPHTHGGSSSGGWSSSGGHTPPTGGSSSSSGGTKVPEPGMLGMFGAGLVGVGFARARRRRGK